MPVTPQQVIEAFQASQAATTIADATQALGDHLAPLFNQGGGGGTPSSPIIYTQASPSATWGPFPNPFGRPVSVETIGPDGEEFDCSVIHSPSFDSLTIHLGLALAGKAVIF